MKTMFISFAVGLLVGAIYALLRVRSPAPPLVALTGLLGMVWGEQLIQGYLAKRSTSLSTPGRLEQSARSPSGHAAR